VNSDLHPLRGQRLRLLLRREAPLSPTEHRGVYDVGFRWGKRRWRHIEGLRVEALDGQGTDRALLELRYAEPDIELTELPEIARVMDQLLRAVPDARPFLDDPGALFGQRGGRFVAADLAASPVPALEPHHHRAPEALLSPPSDLPALPPPPRMARVTTEGELADLLQAIARVGPDPALLRAGAGSALANAVRLHALAEAGILPSAAIELLRTLAERDLAVLDDAMSTAQGLISSGDGRERAAARRLLGALDMPASVTDPDAWKERDEPAAAADWGAVTALGALLLATPGLCPPEEEHTDPGADEDDEDLLLLDEGDEEGGDSALHNAIRAALGSPLLSQTRGLISSPAFAQRALERIAGDDATAAGALLLLAEGVWPAPAIPGLLQALETLAFSGRLWVLRALAARALGRARRPDAAGVLLVLSRSPAVELATEAIHALGGLPGAAVRQALRERLGHEPVAHAALAALAAGGDPLAFRLAVDQSPEASPTMRRAIAGLLDQCGGRRALDLLRSFLDEDELWEVRVEAAAGMVRRGTIADIERTLADPDADLVAAALRAIGEADRAEVFRRVEAALRDSRPRVREAAAVALGRLGLPAATAPLIGILHDRDADVVLAAVEALGKVGDRRAVAALRRLGAQDGSIGQAARLALRTGPFLRLQPADGRLRISAEATDLITDAQRERLLRIFERPRVDLRLRDRGLSASAELDPVDLDRLAAVVEAIDQADAEVHGLVWSVRDGHYAIRRHAGTWVLSGRRGAIVRDAGWFDEILPTAWERPSLQVAFRPSAEASSPQRTSNPRAAPAARPSAPASPLFVGVGPAPKSPVAPEPEPDDEAPELTLSAFMEEATSALAPEPAAPSASPPDLAFPDPSDEDEVTGAPLSAREAARPAWEDLLPPASPEVEPTQSGVFPEDVDEERPTVLGHDPDLMPEVAFLELPSEAEPPEHTLGLLLTEEEPREHTLSELLHDSHLPPAEPAREATITVFLEELAEPETDQARVVAPVNEAPLDEAPFDESPLDEERPTQAQPAEGTVSALLEDLEEHGDMTHEGTVGLFLEETGAYHEDELELIEEELADEATPIRPPPPQLPPSARAVPPPPVLPPAPRLPPPPVVPSPDRTRIPWEPEAVQASAAFDVETLEAPDGHTDETARRAASPTALPIAGPARHDDRPAPFHAAPPPHDRDVSIFDDVSEPEPDLIIMRRPSGAPSAAPVPLPPLPPSAPPPVRRRNDPWSDLLDPIHQDRGLRLLSSQGLTESDVERVLGWLVSSHPMERIAACRVIETLGDPAPVAALVALLPDANAEVRRATVRALGAIGDRACLVHLARLVADRDPDVRFAVKEAMSAITGPPSPRRA
jgi:HEAT repeat protein